MSEFLSPELIEKFRDLMNENYYGYRKFRNVNGKDDWGLICSQMDWIETWVKEIENIDIKNNSSYRNKINITQLILGIDTIFTATKCLLDYFNINYNKVESSKNIFTKNHFKDSTDFDYFKKIRSTCAIHPTDIYSQNGNKYYASWVSNFFRTNKFNIFVYSEDPNQEELRLKIDREELLLFASKWYEKIEDLNSYLESKVCNYD